MKNIAADDPLKDKDIEEQNQEIPQKESPIEETESSSGKITQENDTHSPGEEVPTATAEEKPENSDDLLINDHEERQKNDSYDDDLDHDFSEQTVEESSNFNLLSKEDLVKLLREKLDNPGRGNIKKDVDEIRKAFYEQVNLVNEEKKRHFLEDEGNLEDFLPSEDPAEIEMKELLLKYQGLKTEFARQLEKSKQENLNKKQEILEQLRLLMEGQENFEITFRKFKDLQKQWFSSGVVPPQNLKDLWDSYNYYVDKFNDYVHINRDLRALDLKKNVELKVKLCERTEELDNEPNIVLAFRTLQKLHTQWREIGPIPRDQRDEIWERFKQATSVINRKHQEYHSRLKESLQENLERKIELCTRVERIAEKNYDTHGAWVDKTNQVLEIQKAWKSIGYAPKKDNNTVYSRFRTACDVFFNRKAAFYASAYDEQKGNLKSKIEITEKAESLINSEDWKETTTQLIALQKKWKEIGPVPRRESDKLWKRFRAACDTFFHNKSKYFENIDSTFDDNLKAKEKLIKEMDEFNPSGNRTENMKALDELQSRFNAIGYVPSGKKELIKEQFREALERFLEKMGMDESDRSIYRFQSRVQALTSAPRYEIKLNFERDKLANKLQQLRSDISVWENNIGFFKQTHSSEETIQGFQEKIEAARERIRVLEEKIAILDDMDNAN